MRFISRVVVSVSGNTDISLALVDQLVMTT